MTPDGSAPSESDPLILCKSLKEKRFTLGHLVLRPFEEKPSQRVLRDTMVSCYVTVYVEFYYICVMDLVEYFYMCLVTPICRAVALWFNFLIVPF